MGGFLGGALSGFADEYNKNKGSGGGGGGMLKKLFKKRSAKGQVNAQLSSGGDESGPSDGIQSAKRGGRVRKGGLLRVHKGEDIVPAKRKRGRRASGKRR
jgi:hypothetical protein